MQPNSGVDLTVWTPADLELEARRQYLDGSMSVGGYHIVSELHRRLTQEGCRCLQLTENYRRRIIRTKDCPFHAGLPNVG